MGLDVYSHAVLGMLVDREDFFKPSGSKLQCIGCLRAPEGLVKKFCAECGGKISSVPVEAPVAGFVMCAQKYKKTPDEFWDILYDRYDSGVPGHLGIFQVDAQQSGGDREPTLALGFKLERSRSHRDPNRTSVMGFGLDELESLKTKLLEQAEEFNLGFEKRLVQIFVCVYLSY